MSTSALSTRGLDKSFGSLVVASDIELDLPPGERYALIGPNGAGKTTLINLITGMLKPDKGQIFLGPDEITMLKPEERVKCGLVRTFQINTLFRSLPVLDNVALAVAERLGTSNRMWKAASKFSEVKDETEELLVTLGLGADALTPVSDLPYGKQRLVEIAIALGMKPRVLLLDEPAAGVPSHESGRVIEVLDALPAEIAILIIEHDMDLVFRFAQRITVLVQGQVLVEGTPNEIAADKRVRDVYLGEGANARQGNG